MLTPLMQYASLMMVGHRSNRKLLLCGIWIHLTWSLFYFYVEFKYHPRLGLILLDFLLFRFTYLMKAPDAYA